MKTKTLLIVAALALLASCSSDNSEEPVSVPVTVTIDFSQFSMGMTPFTRTAISEVSTHLDIWLSDGTTTTVYNQTNADEGFGTLTLSLDRTKTYTMYAVAHKCDDVATLTDGIISFPDDKVKETFYYTTTFSPNTTSVLSPEMSRIVCCLRMEITDNIPATVKKMRFTIADVYDRWSVTDGPAHQLDRVATITYNGTSSVFNVYAFATDTETTHAVTVDALGENDAVILSRTFNDVPFCQNYKTVITGAFFSNPSLSVSFTAGEWNIYDEIHF